MESVGPASEQAESWLAPQRVPSGATSLVGLAVEELATNCVNYDYDDSNDYTADILLSVDDGALRVEVIDDGRAFNPLEVWTCCSRVLKWWNGA